MVASAHPLATLTGIEVLKGGGTAADAAVAVNAVLAVTQPHCCGVGGDLFCLYHEAATGRVHFLNGAGRSGSRASLDELGRRGYASVPTVGPAAVSVPGCVRGWAMLLDRFGTRPLGELLAPAIHHAERGFPVTRLLGQVTQEMATAGTDPEWRRIFMPREAAPALGELLVQPDLAETLRAVAAGGPDAFYGGRIAEAIAARLEAEGFLTRADLAQHSGEWAEPLHTTYRGFTVYETGLPTQGIAALLALNLLEGFDVGRLPLHSAEHLHLLIEMVKLAYADRDRWVGDPEATRLPVDGLLSKSYGARRRSAFDPRKAQHYAAGDPSGDTTGFVVADARGNLISVIQSLFRSFGSGVVAPGTGVVLHNRGSYFHTDPRHPNCLAPRKRPFHTLIASIVTRNGRPVMGFATMGSNGQALFHAQVLPNVLDHGLDVQEAIERPRFLLGPFTPDEPVDVIRMESRIEARVIRALERRGHTITVEREFFQKMGHAQGIVVRGGTLMGGADPRGDGAALGY
jgi:gamma-glutamyltranspeptidase/glutathione hydrolase